MSAIIKVLHDDNYGYKINKLFSCLPQITILCKNPCGKTRREAF